MSSNNDTLLRQWEMLRLIPRYPKKITARDVREFLARRGFDVTKRTIERDLQALSEVFPLVSDEREKPYGWSWQKDAPCFDLPRLTSTEALGLKLLEKYLNPLLPASAVDQLKPHFKAAGEVLNSAPRRPKAASWLGKVGTAPDAQPLLAPKVDAAIQRTVYEALLDDRQITVEYARRGQNGPVKYTLHSLAVVQRGAVTYLVATVFDYKEPRIFALHRIRKATMLDDACKRLEGFDLEEYTKAGAFGWGSEKTLKLEAVFDRGAVEHLYETPLSADQRFVPLDEDRTKLYATVTDTPQLRWWLLGFGELVEVVKPEKLRKELGQTALNMSRIYYGSATK